MADRDLERMRALRAELTEAAGGPGIWPLLVERFPDARVALDLAYELGYEDGGNSAWADFHEDNPAAVERAREVLGLEAEASGG